MFKVRKLTENDFNISQSTGVKASKFYVILRLDLNSFFPKFCILTSFHSEIIKVRKSTPNGFNSNVNISESTTVKASNFYMIITLDFSNSSPKLGILTSFHSEMLKVRKSTKNDFKWRLNISRNMVVKAFKFYMIIGLDLSNSFLKFGILNVARSTNCRLLKKVLKWLYFKILRSCMTETYTTFILVFLRPWYSVSCF